MLEKTSGAHLMKAYVPFTSRRAIDPRRSKIALDVNPLDL
jgi:hypothetical protein